MKTKTRAVKYRQGVVLAVALSLMPATTLWADTMEEMAPSAPSTAVLQSTYGKLPLSFEANHGQWDPSVQFVTRGSGHQLFLTPSEAVLTLRTGQDKPDRRERNTTPHTASSSLPSSSHSVVRMQFTGADPQAEMVGLEPLPGIVNYFIGDDPTKWRTNIPTYQKVGYKDLYPGIDLVYYGNQGQLEYDLVVAPGADPSQIRLAFDGAEQVAVDEQGDLVLTLLSTSSGEAGTAASTIRLHKPIVYQRDEQGEKHLLASAYVLQTSEATSSTHPAVAVHSSETQQVSFQVASYDASQPLIIDPVLSWATYLGGSGLDGGHGIAVDLAGNAYVVGGTASMGSGFPGTAGSSLQRTYAGGDSDAFVTKLNAAGTALIYSTYLGGTGFDSPSGIAVDQVGNAYVVGSTTTVGSGFPGTAASPIQNTNGGGFDAFVTKLNAAGTAILFSTYLGGGSDDGAGGIVVDLAGQAYVTGSGGPGFPITIPNTCVANSDAFVAKLDVTGTSLIYSTCLGGSNDDGGRAIAIDQEGNAYVTGIAGIGFAGTAHSLIQSTFGGGYDAFVTKVNATGTGLIYSTYLGGSGIEQGLGIAVDKGGNAYVVGGTTTPGSGFPGTTGSPIQSTNAGGSTGYDGFVIKLNAAGTAILFSTYLGGSGDESAFGIAVDQAGNAYVVGGTDTVGSGFPGTADSPIQSTYGGGQGDAFVVKLNMAGTVLVYSSYLGGSGWDSGSGIAVDQAGNAYVVGNTATPVSGFPGTSGSLIQSTYAGPQVPLNDIGDAFVAKITSTNLVNDLVTFEPLAATYRTSADSTGCPSGFVGKFGFDARLTNENSSPPLSDLAVKVKTLSNGNLLHNADGSNGGVGSMLMVPKQSGYADGTLTPGESVVVHFSICLKTKKPFTFFVDMLGMH